MSTSFFFLSTSLRNKKNEKKNLLFPVGVETSHEWSTSKDETYTRTFEGSTQINVAPNTTVKCSIVSKEGQVDVPYTAMLQSRLTNATAVQHGVWTGSAYSSTTIDVVPIQHAKSFMLTTFGQRQMDHQFFLLNLLIFKPQ